MQQHYLVGIFERGLDVMGHNDRGYPEAALKLVHQVVYSTADDGIEASGWLIVEQKAGLHHKRPGDGSALAHPAAKLIGILGIYIGQANQLQFFVNPVGQLTFGKSQVLDKGESDILKDCQRIEQGGVLEDIAGPQAELE